MHSAMGPYPQNNAMGNYQGGQYGPQGEARPRPANVKDGPNEFTLVVLRSPQLPRRVRLKRKTLKFSPASCICVIKAL